MTTNGICSTCRPVLLSKSKRAVATIAGLLAMLAAAAHAGNGNPWSPKPAPSDAPIEAARVRIVDFGADFLRGGDGQPRHHFHCHRYAMVQDKETKLWRPNDRPVQLDLTVDVDGDGKTDDDVVGYHEFSLDRPFSPVAPWYDTLAGTPRWYGGQAIYQANRRNTGFSEDGVNQDHDGPFCWPRENWAVFHETYEIYSPYRLAVNWLWLKQDFLNGGAANRVTFDDQSRLALVLKRYFMCIDSVRFLVRDGRQCFLSEPTFRLVGTHTLEPAKARWARYDPQGPHDIYFDIESAEFKEHTFEDVTAVGVYASKDRFIPSYFGYKWYAFEADAVVHRRKRPSETVAMVKVACDGGGFCISKTEVPYELWKNVFRLARSNDFVPPSQGFGFEKDGDCGSMDFGDAPHSLQEPATDFTLHDAAAWCNALSEMESRESAYYEDSAFEKPLHEVRWSPAFAKPRPLPKLYVKWSADGYRLPTPDEWQRAFGEQTISPADAVIGENSKEQTQPVGTKNPSAAGVYDLLGNVWEPVWTFGDCFDPAKAPPITVLGGDFLYPSDPARRSASPYGDSPYDGSYNIGLRLVRREAGGAPPSTVEIASGVLAWTIAKGSVTRGSEAPSRPVVKPDMVAVPGTQVEIARHETTFALWKQVRDWAVAHGYDTDYDGDMGSMDYWGFDPVAGRAEPSQMHMSDEPVTDITAYDMAVWCNALSDLMGRKPVYYADREFNTVYKTAVKFRPIQFHFPEDYIAKYGQPEKTDTPSFGMGAGASQSLPGVYVENAMERVLPTLYTDAQADGFRLPSVAEYQQAVVPDAREYPWGNDAKGGFEHAWLFDTARGTTHPVGQKKPTALGLYDVLGNVSELSSPGPQTRMRTTRLGGSILDLTVGLNRGLLSSDAPPTTWPYCDTGFRIVRQLPEEVSLRPEAASLVCVRRRSYARRRSPDLAETVDRRSPATLETFGQPHVRGRRPAHNEPPEMLNIDTANFDPLQGQVHRGNLYRGGVFQATGVTEVKGVKWRFQTEGPIKSSPVVVDGIAYVGSNDNHIYAVDAEKGTEVWKVETRGAVAGSAAVVGGVVFIASEDGRMFALDARTGEKMWVTPFSRQRPCGSPAVAYGVVFIGEGAKGGHDTGVMTGGPVVGLDAKTGEVVWRGPSGPQGYAAICLDERALYAGTNGSNFGAVDLATGKSLWSHSGGHQNRQFMSFTRAGDLAYVPGSMTGTVMAWDPVRGRTKWHEPIWPEQRLPINNGGTPGYEVYADLAVAHGRVYAASNDGTLRTFDADTGKRGWMFETGSPIQSSPSVAGQTIYFGCWDGNVYAVDALTGELRWKHKPSELLPPDLTVGGNGPSARIISAPWPGDNAVYVGCDDGCLYALH